MPNAWMLLWVIFMLIFFLTMVSYKRSFRGWDTPYPGYCRIKKSAAGGIHENLLNKPRAMVTDMLWIVFSIGLLWAVIAMLW
jgi:hypothetical protein